MAKIKDLLGNYGTPKDLDEAIMQAMTCGPLSDFAERMRSIFEDYLRQRFATLMLIAKNESEEKLLTELLEQILRRAK